MRRITHERALFLERMYEGLKLFFERYGMAYSRPCVRLMKLIVKQLQYELYLYEKNRIDRLRREGKVTPKEAVRMMAENKRQYMCRSVKSNG